MAFSIPFIKEKKTFIENVKECKSKKDEKNGECVEINICDRCNKSVD